MREFEITSKPENVALACSEMRSEAAAAGMPDQASMELELAVSEVVTNIIEHAYKWDEEQDIHLKIATSERQLLIDILDHGEPIPEDLFTEIDGTFDAPDNEIESLAESGRGLNIIRALVDEIHIQRKGEWNSLKLAKKF